MPVRTPQKRQIKVRHQPRLKSAASLPDKLLKQLRIKLRFVRRKLRA